MNPLPALAAAPKPSRLARPDWLKVRLTTTGEFDAVNAMMRRLRLVTVCEEARCPNIHECWARERTATFMLLGDVCTRHCGFCAVEVLIPDFQGNEDAIDAVLDASPDVLNHNIETVPRLYRRVRPDAVYERSLALLARADRRRRTDGSAVRTKSGIMAGLGETAGEIVDTLADLRAHGCDIATIGQYLQPYEKRLPVEKYYTPAEFEALRAEGLRLGFAHVESGPLVRSSYHARHALEKELP
ncbi:MAG TPA: radical SAM protein [Thermoanaerobaculia bacterium]|nr:radical SAM protein [Thermoanaerobaculia bacterium]